MLPLPSALPYQKVLLPIHPIARGSSVQPSLSFYAIKVDAVSSQPGLIHSPQLMFDIHKNHPPAFRLRMLFHLITPSLYLLSAAVNFLVFIGTAVQTVSTAQMNFCQRVVNKHTIIDSHSASSSFELLEMLFVPTRIITLGIPLGSLTLPSEITGLSLRLRKPSPR